MSRINDKKGFKMKKNILLLALFAIVAAMPARAEESVISNFDAEAPTDIMSTADVEFQNVQIAVEGTQVHVSGAEGMTMEVYNLTGVKVSATKIDSDDSVINLNLQHGCYILKVGKVVRKISIR